MPGLFAFENNAQIAEQTDTFGPPCKVRRQHTSLYNSVYCCNCSLRRLSFPQPQELLQYPLLNPSSATDKPIMADHLDHEAVVPDPNETASESLQVLQDILKVIRTTSKDLNTTTRTQISDISEKMREPVAQKRVTLSMVAYLEDCVSHLDLAQRYQQRAIDQVKYLEKLEYLERDRSVTGSSGSGSGSNTTQLSSSSASGQEITRGFDNNASGRGSDGRRRNRGTWGLLDFRQDRALTNGFGTADEVPRGNHDVDHRQYGDGYGRRGYRGGFQGQMQPYGRGAGGSGGMRSHW